MPGTTLYGGVIWGRKMCQVQLYMVVLFGKGRCSRYNSIWWCYLGKEDVPGTTLYGGVISGREDVLGTTLYGGVILGREDVLGTTLYGGVIWGGKMFQKQLYMVVLLGNGKCTKSRCMMV